MKLIITFFSVLIILGFGGCASKNISPDKLKSISTVGILSLHGNKMEAIERGLTIFGSEDSFSDISLWKIDKYITDEIISNLSKNKTYTAIPINLPTDKIAQFNLIQENEKDDFFKKIILKNNVDILLVMTKGNYVPEIHDITRGVAIIKAKTLGMENTAIKTNLYLQGYELENGKIKLLHHNHIHTFGLLENSIWVDTKKPIPNKNLLIIEKEVKKLLSKTIKEAIAKSGY